MCALTVSPVLAAEEEGTRVRISTGEHPGFGRIVLEAGTRGYRTARDGGQVLIVLEGDVSFGAMPRPPKNVTAIAPMPGGLALTVPRGSVIHDQKQGAKIVIDIDDPPAPAEPPPPAEPPRLSADSAPPAWAEDMAPEPEPPAPEPAPPPPKQVEARPAQDQGAPKAEAASPAPPAAEPVAEQIVPVIGETPPAGPVALVATLVPPPAGVTGATLQIPFSGTTGAAMFSRGPETWVVFDERRPIDLTALAGDPVFGHADVTIHPSATVIHVTAPPGQMPLLSRAGAGWRISIGATLPAPGPLTPVASEGTLDIPAEAPGRVVAITDPHNGAVLLAGTQRRPGQALLAERRTAEFNLPVTGQGLIVAPLSNTIALHVAKAGFTLTGPAGGLALSAPPAMAEAVLAAARLTRRFEFPGQTTSALAWRARWLARDAATSPPLARGPKRLALAECLIGLGMGVEAQTVLQAAAKDDPRISGLADFQGLSAIAALLANRPEEAASLDDPRLSGTDEMALWRAIRQAMADDASPAAAEVLATAAPLLMTYPDELRRRVLPVALETMVLGGRAKPAERLLTQRPHDPDLAYARALAKRADGDLAGALTDFTALANARSPFDHARASVQAIETKLAMGTLDDKAAAEALEKRLYAWRGDRTDLRLRERIADLDRRAGAWRQVFAVLRDARRDFPDQAPEIDRQLKDAFAALPKDPAMDKMPPTELIGLLEENVELLASGPEGEPMRERLAEKLMALDLPRRADPVLTSLMRAAPIGPARAGFGATLATMRLLEDDGDGALVALSESNSDDMPAPVRERRALITARVEAKRGHVRSAVEALANIDSPAANETRAAILEQARDWPAAVKALTALAAGSVPASGPVNDDQVRILVRLATAATHAADETTLGTLRERFQARIGSGAAGDMFRLLTEAPVHGTADLTRARAEISLARAVAAETAAPKPATGVH